MYHLVKLELRLGWMGSRDTTRWAGHVKLDLPFFCLFISWGVFLLGNRMSHCMGEAKSCAVAAKSQNRGKDAFLHLTYPMRFGFHHRDEVPLAVVAQPASWKYISLDIHLESNPLPASRAT